MYTPKNWDEFQIKAVVNLFRHNVERSWLSGPLDSLSGEHVNYLKEKGIVKLYGDDFYIWREKDSIERWLKLKAITLKELSEGKGYQMNNADIIESSIYGKLKFTRRHYVTGEEIDKIIPTQEERNVVYPMFKAFDVVLDKFYKTNIIVFTS